jgi:N-acetylglucosaminyldiphosphoundecaprenol N-acetyl-beta-D-mannosaminyltransferase
VVGVPVTPTRLCDAVAAIGAWIDAGESTYVCVSDVHAVLACHDDPDLAAIHAAAGMVTTDGMPLVWMARALGRPAERVCGPDLLPAVVADGLAAGRRHYLYGSTAAVVEQLRANLLDRFPGARVVGAYSPPFRPLTDDEDAAIVAAINAAEPDVVWVGLGAPKQERWMAAHRAVLRAPVLVGVGAAFDFHAGTKRRPPRWVQQAGLEWAFRLASEPRRLWRRYVHVVPRFVLLASGQLLARAR